MSIGPAFSLMLGVILFLFFGSFGYVSFREQEHRAARLSWVSSFVTLLLFFALALVPSEVQVLAYLLLAIIGIGVLLWLFLDRSSQKMKTERSWNRFDERDIVFSRHGLREGTAEYQNYYAMHPENEEVDARTRKSPGLLSDEAKEANTPIFESAEACFMFTEALHIHVEPEVEVDVPPAEPDKMSTFVKGFALYLGAKSVGIAQLEPVHVYSHSGRGTDPYGERIINNHAYAIAFTVEMSYEMMGSAPRAPVVLESARQYVEGAKIAVLLSNLLSQLGYHARAHIDGNYQVIAPLVARDAGLGEIGRMGLLMTPDLGPRVRIGVVTTDAPLVTDERMDGAAMIDFCTRCKKCAENCPSRSIPLDDRRVYDGAYRWKIDPVSCFRYWNVIGTDCGVCMKVCPYSHPDTFFHNILRGLISHSAPGRHIALKLDDVFYGRYPEVRPAPDWTKHGM